MTERSVPSSLLPDVPFYEHNHRVIGEIFDQLDKDFPDSGAANVLDDSTSRLSPQAMQWMWTRLMGRQHGTSEGLEGKVPLTTDYHDTYWPLVRQLRYGDHGFTDAKPADHHKHYTHHAVLGGLPHEMVARLRAGGGPDPRESNIDATTLMVGQRLRWHEAPGERSIPEILDHVARYSGANMDRLHELSPWLRAELKRPDENEWAGPFATELEIGRLAAEAHFRDLIDWKNYDVEITKDPDAAERSYDFRDETRVVPPREDTVITYHLLNGQKLHILNAATVPRVQGVPRPTSDSQSREMVNLGLVGKQPESLVVSVSPPHIRAGIDVFIRLLQQRVDLVRADIATHSWLEDKEILSALGEIPATYKADLRLRALAHGDDPDSPELASL